MGKLKSDVLSRLKRILGSDNVQTGPSAEEVYSYDASLATGKPDVILFPGSQDQVREVVRALSASGVPFTPRGYGTNLSGGSIASSGGAVICLSRMDRILEILPDRRCAVVEPGVTNLDLQNALSPLGFYFAPDPASQKVSTLGGNAGENSGGPHCVKYGVTTNHILGLDVVLPDGTAARFGGPALDPPGYDLRGLMIGSEGTLAVITEITVRVLPMTEAVATLLVIYDDAADAARSVSDIVAAGIVPATLEMMDAPVMRAVEESFPCGYPRDAAAVLIAEVDGPQAGLRQQVERIRKICTQNGCRSVREAATAAERDLLWAGRRGAFGAVSRLAPNYLVADCTVPRTKLPEALASVARIAKAHDLEHGNVFHAGDGNLHPLLFFDSRDTDQVQRVHKAGWEIMQACVALGGTITGEHGVGIEKAPAMRMVFSEDGLAVQRALRKAFDPEGLLNPGKMFPGRNDAGVDETPAQSADFRQVEQVPADEAEAAEIVRWALSRTIPLLPVGGGRRKGYGNRARSDLTLLSSSRLMHVVEYDAPNQTVTVGAGMTLGSLQDVLAEHNQWLPIRPPLGEQSTAGGVAALGACGPERLRYGAPRDLILGLHFISGKGRPIAAGGKVVKNVAGYDLTRLLIGSAGTLGFLTQLTFRVSAVPESCTVVCGTGSLERCAAIASRLLCSQLEPVFVAASMIDGSGNTTWMLKTGFEGFGITVEWQKGQAVEWLAEAGLHAPVCETYRCRDSVFRNDYVALEGSSFLLRADVPVDRLAGFAAEAFRVLGGARCLLDFGCGRWRAGCTELTDEAWEKLCVSAAACNGHVVLEKAPESFKARHEVFGTSHPEWTILHRVKEALDPHGIFAPGRLPGGR